MVCVDKAEKKTGPSGFGNIIHLCLKFLFEGLGLRCDEGYE
jgi:hypothetical protein